VLDEASRAVRQNKLITTHKPGFDIKDIPLRFGGRQRDTAKFIALEKLLRFR
jgi:hypothetical protein